MDLLDEIEAALNQPESRGPGTRKAEIRSIVSAMLSSLEQPTGMQGSELLRFVTKFEVQTATKSVVVGRDPGDFEKLDPKCSLMYELCWPPEDDKGLLYCIEVKVPWPCPELGAL